MNDPTTNAPTGAENMPPPPPRTPRVAASGTRAAAGDGTGGDANAATMTSPATPYAGVLARTTNQKRRASDDLPSQQHPNKRRASGADGIIVQYQGNGGNGAAKPSNRGDDLEYSGDEEEENDHTSTEQKQKTLSELDSMMKIGLSAFQDRERLQQENTALKDDNASKASELSRLRTALKQKQEIITNLFQAVESAKTDTRQSSRSVVAEATLRVELAQATEEKNQALVTAAGHQRRVTQLEQASAQTKAKLTRVTQEKFKLEREQRVSQQLAQSADQHAATDVEFYKRKVTELTGQVQSLNAVVMEKNHLIEDMQRQIERSLSRQAAAQKRSKDSNHRHHS